jgi:hypothetical protein
MNTTNTNRRATDNVAQAWEIANLYLASTNKFSMRDFVKFAKDIHATVTPACAFVAWEIVQFRKPQGYKNIVANLASLQRLGALV